MPVYVYFRKKQKKSQALLENNIREKKNIKNKYFFDKKMLMHFL